MENLKLMLKIAWQQNRLFIIYQLILNTIRGPFPLLIAYINKLIIDKVTDTILPNNYSFLSLLYLTFFTIFIQILYEYFMTLDTKLSIISSNNMFVKIQDMILGKLKILDQAHFDKIASRDIIYRGKNFDYELLHSLINSISTLMRELFTAFIAAIILLKYNSSLVIIASILYIPKIFIGKIIVKQNHKLEINLTQLNRKQEYYREILESKEYSKELRVYGCNDFFINKFQDVSKKIYKLNKKYLYINLIAAGTIDLLQILVRGILYTVLVINTYYNKITIGDINFIKSAFDDLSSELYSSISMMIELYKSIISFDFFHQFLELENHILKTDTKGILPIKNGGKHKIEFRNVFFAYPESKRYVLKDISFIINKEESTALIGVNGSGKSTIIKLLLRLYDPEKGMILVDDIDIKKYNPYEYYKMWGIFYQDYNLYPMTIAKNTALGVKKENIEISLLKKASKMSDTSDLIESLPKKFDTQLFRIFDSDGYEPSGGEAQKLALSKLFYKEFEMYILDEPSASIDAKAEEKLFNSVNHITKYKTAIFISHRLSNIKFCDKIILIKDGKVLEEGSHNKLINNKYYSELFHLQSDSYITREMTEDELQI